jgi:uncharacterized protein involved in type VI secretion and phage assembly
VQAGDRNNYACDVRLRDSGLELKRVPVATGRIGTAAIPNPDDLVLVQFLHGDVHAAIVTARLYNDVDRPPQAADRECVYVCPDAAESGVRRLYLEYPNGNALQLDDDALVLSMGRTKLTINHDGDVVVESNAKLTITTGGDTALTAQGNLALKASGDVTVEGNSVALKATTSASLQGGTDTTVKGLGVKIAGRTDFSAA